MGDSSPQGGRVLFIFTLWTTLATALLCALLPTGLPLTSPLGSAFSPATSIVTLRGKTEQLKPPEEKLNPKSDPDGAPGLSLVASHQAIVVPHGLTVVSVQAILPVTRYAFAFSFPLSSPAMARAFPRGPPLA